MTAAPTNSEEFRQDPVYQAGMQAMQAGHWPEAIRAFESLVNTYGDVASLRRILNEALFRADLDSHTRVYEQRWSIPWRTLAPRLLLIAGAVVLAIVIVGMIQSQVTPALTLLQNQQSFQRRMAEAHALLEAEQFGEAKTAFQNLLAADPANPNVQAALVQVDQEQAVHDLYQQGVAAQTANDYAEALRIFQQVLLQAPSYKDTSLRVQQVRETVDRNAIVQMADAAYQDGDCQQAIHLYEELRSTSAARSNPVVEQRLYDCYMDLGHDALEQRPVTIDIVGQAKESFVRALALRPRSSEAALEEELATLYVAGQRAYANSEWEPALVAWQTIYLQRPGYLGGAMIAPMYDAYIHSGDDRRDHQDYFYAYEQYRKATELAVPDNSLARSRIDSVRPFLTPTPTPTVTPTTTPYQPPTAVPSPTPPAPLVTYHNQIVFKSDKEDQRGFWLMAPDGSNRRFLGSSQIVEQQYDALRQTQSTSLDGRYRVYVTTGETDDMPQVYIQGQRDQYGNVATWRVTDLGSIAYDPVWSPDGSRIAFVSQLDGSDDVWVVYPDGSEPHNLTRNEWQWDKQPWWSPDGKRIVFWSNRDGVQQIYVMDANGQNLRRLSNTTWDESEPIWIK